MANILDVIKLSPAKSTPPKAVVDGEAELATMIKDASAASKKLHELGVTIDRNSLAVKLNEHLATATKAMFDSTLTVPELYKHERRVEVARDGEVSLYQTGRWSAYGSLACYPTTTLEELRRITDVLGMVIMPYEALTSKSLSNEDWDVRSKVDRFTNRVSNVDGLSLFVVAPISLYDIAAHVRSEAPALLYGNNFEQVLQTITLQIPLFRSLHQMVQGLGSRVDALEQHRKTVDLQLMSLQTQVNQIEQRVNEMRRQQQEQEVRIKQAEAASAQAAATARWIAEDPLIFAVQNKLDIFSGTGRAIVGPCWGPDFPEVLMQVSGLKVVKGQRAKYGQD